MEGIGSAGFPVAPRGPERMHDAERSVPSREPGRLDPGASRTEAASSSVAPAAPANISTELAPFDGTAIPEGVDPELWGLLTTEERAHFARFAAMGGVTYGPQTNRAGSPFGRGRRLDVRI